MWYRVSDRNEPNADSPTFLLFAGHRYGADLTPDQKDALLDVIRARPHPQISPEIRREILTSVMRGEPRPEEGEGDVEMR